MKAIMWGTMFASAALWWPLAVPVAAQPPQVAVEFLMTPLPETLGLEDPTSEIAQRIADKLLEEATTRLNDSFPFIDWVKVADSEPDPIARLSLEMKVGGIGNRVFIDCKVTNRAGDETALNIFARDVYPGDLNFPTPSEVEAMTISNGTSVLEELIKAKWVEWQEKLTRKIPISRRIVHPKPTVTYFILPLREARLMAKADSVLSVRFRARVGNDAQGIGEITLNPTQPVFEQDDEFFEMQRCEVKHYAYPGVDEPGWHEKIPEVLANLVPRTLRVFMHMYVKKDPDPIADSFD